MARTFNPSLPVQTRDGRKARIICTDRDYGIHPIIALVVYEEAQEVIISYTKEGATDSGGYSGTDLVNVPKIQQDYQIVYPTMSVVGTGRHKTLELAKTSLYQSSSKAKGILRLTFEDDVLTSSEVVYVCT